jgi:hypothetical protein
MLRDARGRMDFINIDGRGAGKFSPNALGFEPGVDILFSEKKLSAQFQVWDFILFDESV